MISVQNEHSRLFQTEDHRSGTVYLFYRVCVRRRTLRLCISGPLGKTYRLVWQNLKPERRESCKWCGGSRNASDGARHWSPAASCTLPYHQLRLHAPRRNLNGARRTTRYYLGSKLTFRHDDLKLALHRGWDFVISFLVISATPWTVDTTGGGGVQFGSQTQLLNSG